MKQKKKNAPLFTKGDVILTSPEKGYYGIAVVLDDGCITCDWQSGKNPKPVCHIAITPLIFDHIVTLEDIDPSTLKPLLYERRFALKGRPEAYRKELLVHIFLTENVCNLPILGKVDPLIVFQGDLLWNSPGGDIGIFHLYGPINDSFGREAYLAWKQK